MLQTLVVSESKWYPDTKALAQKQNEKESVNFNKFSNWLTKPYILSKSMKQLCNNITVTVVQQQKDYILPSEALSLQLQIDTTDTYVRKVYLSGDETPWEYARVIVPNATYTTYQQAFESLGGKLIGETLLYNNPKTTRNNFEFTILTQKNYIYEEIKKHLPKSLNNVKTTNNVIYGRRSIFHIDGVFPLLICEFFLPAIPEYKDKD